MNYCAIISEFNPFTNGHEYILNKAKQETGLDIICLMSGDFVQRGEAAVLNKYERARLAIENHASVVLELPLVYAVSSAEFFASGAIKILSGIKNITHLAFGIETSNIPLLEKLAKIKASKNNQIKEILKKETKKGINYNKAMIKALKTLSLENEADVEEFFTGSNNVLALEYLTAIYKQKANLIPVYIKRTDKGYNSKTIQKVKYNNNTTLFASASCIRELSSRNKIKQIKKLVPLNTYELLTNKSAEFYKNKNLKLETLILNKIRELNPDQLEKYYDYNQSLANLIYKTSLEETSLENLINKVSGKSFRPARVKKLLLYPLFSITKSSFEEIYNSEQVVNVLAVNESHKQELSKLKNQSTTNLIVSIKDYNNVENKKSLELNQYSSNIYNLITKKLPNKDKTIFI